MEDKEYYSIDEAAQILSVNRATVYKWVDKLQINRYRFSMSKKVFLASADVERLRQAKEKPWLIEKAIPIEDSENAA